MEKRLNSRATDSQEKIKERVAKAEKELKFAPEFDVIVTNTNLENAKEEAYNLVKKFVK